MQQGVENGATITPSIRILQLPVKGSSQVLFVR